MKETKTIITSTISLFLIAFLSTAQVQESFVLKNISLNKLEDKLEVQLELDQLLNYETFTLLNPNRLVIDLLQVEDFLCNPFIEVNDSGVQVIRTAKNRPDVTRVVFDLTKKPPLYTIEENEKGLSILFWFEEEELEEVQPEVEEKPVEVEEKQPELEKKEEVKPPEKIPSEILEKISKEEEAKKEIMIISLGFNNGPFFLQDADFQNSYGKSAYFFSGETIFQIPLKKHEYIGASFSFKNLTKTGLTTLKEEQIKMRLSPISFGALYLRQFGIFMPFVGFGVDYHNFKETYPKTFAIPYLSGSAWGISFQVGTYIRIVSSLSLKMYFKYYNAETKLNEVNVNLGGNEYGLGLAYHFKIF